MEIPQETIDRVLAELAGCGKLVSVPNGDPFVIVPAGCALYPVTGTLPEPVRKRASRAFTEVDSFIGYVNDQKSDSTRLYVTSPTEFVAVINHHEPSGVSPSKAGYEDHTAKLTLTLTPQWQTWTGKNGGRFGQREFSVFVEDNAEDIVRPAGTDMLDLIRTVRSTSSADFTGIVNEDTPGNSELSYVEKATTKAGAKGNLSIPADFDLSIAPYEGGARETVKTRLRFEINNGRLFLWYEMVKVQAILRHAVQAIAATIQDQVELSVWYGKP